VTKTEYSVENLKLLLPENLIIIIVLKNYYKENFLFCYLYQPGIDTFNETVSKTNILTNFFFQKPRNIVTK